MLHKKTQQKTTELYNTLKEKCLNSKKTELGAIRCIKFTIKQNDVVIDRYMFEGSDWRIIIKDNVVVVQGNRKMYIMEKEKCTFYYESPRITAKSLLIFYNSEENSLTFHTVGVNLFRLIINNYGNFVYFEHSNMKSRYITDKYITYPVTDFYKLFLSDMKLALKDNSKGVFTKTFKLNEKSTMFNYFFVQSKFDKNIYFDIFDNSIPWFINNSIVLENNRKAYDLSGICSYGLSRKLKKRNDNDSDEFTLQYQKLNPLLYMLGDLFIPIEKKNRVNLESKIEFRKIDKNINLDLQKGEFAIRKYVNANKVYISNENRTIITKLKYLKNVSNKENKKRTIKIDPKKKSIVETSFTL